MEACASNLLGTSAKLVWECVALSLAYGVLTMAFLQFAKDIYTRRAFNRVHFNKYMAYTAGAKKAIRKELLNLAAAGDEDALFGLPIEKMAGQINVAANTVIENPSRSRELLVLLASEMLKAVQRRLCAANKAGHYGDSWAYYWRQYAMLYS